MPERCLFPRTGESVPCRRTDAPKLRRAGSLDKESGTKKILIDKITLKGTSYPTKLLIPSISKGFKRVLLEKISDMKCLPQQRTRLMNQMVCSRDTSITVVHEKSLVQIV